uniref:Uncharacterized protein n=1 Tax=Anguilla anguilla TaxID=7936 RepID=A0A0E9WI01_ANGAN
MPLSHTETPPLKVTENYTESADCEEPCMKDEQARTTVVIIITRLLLSLGVVVVVVAAALLEISIVLIY